MATTTDPNQKQPGRGYRLLLWLCILLSLAYLIAIPFVVPPEKRLGASDALILAVVLLFASGLVSQVQEIAFSGTGWSIKLRDIENKVEDVKIDVDTLRFLITYFMSYAEADHLRKLAKAEPFSYGGYKEGSPFWDELHWLRSHGFLTPRTGVRMNDIRDEGADLREYLSITEAGSKFLLLLDQVSS